MRRLLCLSLVFMLPIFVTAQGVKAIDQAVNTSTPATNTNTSTSSRYSDGGYRTQSQVIGERMMVIPYRFRPEDFEPWLLAVWEAQAYSQFEDWVADGTLTPQGLVRSQTLQLGTGTFSQGQLIKIEDLKRNRKTVNPPEFWFKTLVDVGLLTQDGYVVGVTPNNTVNLDMLNTPRITKIVDTVNFQVKSKQLAQALRIDLLDLMITRHKVLEVTKQETTRYNSNSADLFKNMFDQFLGNAIGSVFFPDKVKVDKYAIQWNPSLSAADYFNIRTGLTPYPYFAGGDAFLLLNGAQSNTSLKFGFSQKNSLQYYNANLEYKLQLGSSSGDRPAVSTALFNAFYDQLGDNTGTLRFGGVLASLAGTSRHSEISVGLGPVYQKGVTNSALGLAFALQGKWLPFNPLGFGLGFDRYFQPNIFNGETRWQFNKFELFTSLQMDRVTAQIGYLWLTGPVDVSLLEGWKTQVVLHF